MGNSISRKRGFESRAPLQANYEIASGGARLAAPDTDFIVIVTDSDARGNQSTAARQVRTAARSPELSHRKLR